MGNTVDFRPLKVEQPGPGSSLPPAGYGGGCNRHAKMARRDRVTTLFAREPPNGVHQEVQRADSQIYSRFDNDIDAVRDDARGKGSSIILLVVTTAMGQVCNHLLRVPGISPLLVENAKVQTCRR